MLVRELLRRALVDDKLRDYASVLVRGSNTRRRAAYRANSKSLYSICY
jgi:hypothetical protein